jgi:hypothetical protein
MAISLLVIIACAQAGGHREEGRLPPESALGRLPPELALERLRQELDLTAEQSVKVQALMDESAKQEDEILARYGLRREQFQVLQKDLHLATDSFFAGLQTVLTAEQKRILNQHRQPMERRQPPPPPFGPAALLR